MTYTLIAHTELGSAQANITFSSIPATFTDLVLVYSLRSSGGSSNFGIRFNGSASNFTNRWMYGTGASVASSSDFGNFIGVAPNSGWTASTFGNGQLYIPNYAGSSNKSWSVDAVSEQNATESYQTIVAGLWSQTTAINSLQIYQYQGNNIAQFSSATLYGITAGSSGGVVVS